MSYPNGEWPEHLFVELGRGWDEYGEYRHLAPVGTAARWRELARLAYEKYGVTLRITAGWNVYRPLHWQRVYRADLGIWAAVPGMSSHGMTYQGRACCAIDVNNWRDLAPWDHSLAWARFVALCKIVGFTTNFVTPEELWHIGDFAPLTIPVFAPVKVTPLPVLALEDLMALKSTTIMTPKGGGVEATALDFQDGFRTSWTSDRTYAETIGKILTEGHVSITKSHYDLILGDFDKHFQKQRDHELAVAAAGAA